MRRDATANLAPAAAVYLLAAGWIDHGVWDVIHLRRNAAVTGGRPS